MIPVGQTVVSKYIDISVGLADPLALNQAVSAFQACHFIGRPECDVSRSGIPQRNYLKKMKLNTDKFATNLL
jgi:hypothetical protein